MKKFLAVIALSLWWISLAAADQVVLTNGQKIDGKIIEQTDKYVKIDPGVGEGVTYYMDEVVSITPQAASTTPSPSPVTEPSEAVHPSEVIEPPAAPVVPTPITAEAAANAQLIIQKNEALAQAAKDQIRKANEGQAAQKIQKTYTPSYSYHSSQKPKLNTAQMVGAIWKMNKIFCICMFLFIFFIYFLVCRPLQLLAYKTKTPNAWYAWVPILQAYLMCKLAGKSGWWMILLLIPLVGIIFTALIWVGIARAVNKPGWIGILILLPFVGIIVPWYMAKAE